MGMRLHIAKKYDIQYAITPEGFNWQIEEFHGLLLALNVGFSGDVYDEDFEVYKEELKNGVKTLLADERLMSDEIKEALKELGITAQEAADILQEYIDASDPDNEWMYFSFF